MSYYKENELHYLNKALARRIEALAEYYEQILREVGLRDIEWVYCEGSTFAPEDKGSIQFRRDDYDPDFEFGLDVDVSTGNFQLYDGDAEEGSGSKKDFKETISKFYGGNNDQIMENVEDDDDVDFVTGGNKLDEDIVMKDPLDRRKKVIVPAAIEEVINSAEFKKIYDVCDSYSQKEGFRSGVEKHYDPRKRCFRYLWSWHHDGLYPNESSIETFYSDLGIRDWDTKSFDHTHTFKNLKINGCTITIEITTGFRIYSVSIYDDATELIEKYYYDDETLDNMLFDALWTHWQEDVNFYTGVLEKIGCGNITNIHFGKPQIYNKFDELLYIAGSCDFKARDNEMSGPRRAYIQIYNDNTFEWLGEFESYSGEKETFEKITKKMFNEYGIYFSEDEVETTLIEGVDDTSNSEEINDFIEDLYDLRKESIAKDGEYGLGNLVFKEFRNLGYLDNLKELKNEEKSKELSLSEGAL